MNTELFKLAALFLAPIAFLVSMFSEGEDRTHMMLMAVLFYQLYIMRII